MRLRLPRTLLPSRVLSTGLVSAGLFAAILGATGATAQEATLEASPTATPAAAALVAEPTPAATSAPLPEASPTVAASTPQATPSATAEASPTAAAATPAATPAETATPEATPGRKAKATPTAEARKKKTKRSRKKSSRKRSRADRDKADQAPADELAIGEVCEPGPEPEPETDPAEAEVEVESSAARLPADAPALLTDEFPTEDEKADASTSTSARDCDADEKAGDKKRKKKKKTKKNKKSDRDQGDEHPAPAPRPVPTTNTDGSPATGNPGYALAQPGPARIGVPNFFIEKFRIPPFLLPIYQAAGIQYGIRWELLAAINEIETDYGRNLNVSSAGALGWMQFMPATWKAYGVDANKDGLKDPYNPVDAIFAAARYLRAAGGEKDIRRAVFAYNHADWYVDSVLMRARVIGGLPVDFVGSLTGLTQGRFPVHAKATYAGAIEPGKRKKVTKGNVANVVGADSDRRGIDVFAKQGSPVVAVNDGRVLRIGVSPRLGRFVQLQDVYGNTYTYANLGKVARTYPSPRERQVSEATVRRELDLPRDAKPTRAASAGRTRPAKAAKPAKPAAAPVKPAAAPIATKQRLFANPGRPNARRAGGEFQLLPDAYRPAADDLLRFDDEHYVAKPLRKGSRVIGGTILGRIGARSASRAAHLRFEVRPAGRGAPRVDPKPILDGWKLLESTAVYRAAGKNPFAGEDADAPSIGQILLMSKETLERRVLTNPRIDIYECGRDDIRSGSIDRRVLATLEYLAANGLRPTVSSMRCGRAGRLTASGNVSQHITGDAVDIAAVNGVPIIGNQGRGSITETTIRRLLTLQGTMKPHQIISLMTFEGADNTIAMGDHADHIHLGWRPLYNLNDKTARKVSAILRPNQWIKLIDRLGRIDNPEVPLEPSRYSVKVARPAAP